MSKFKKKGSRPGAGISTASLPDIVFMLLFFFMVTTTMREISKQVEVRPIKASESSKIRKKSLVDHIYVGPLLDRTRGNAIAVQLDDQLYPDARNIKVWKMEQLEKRSQQERNEVVTSFKIDKFTKMKIVADIKEELRDIHALKINYAAGKEAPLY